MSFIGGFPGETTITRGLADFLTEARPLGWLLPLLAEDGTPAALLDGGSIPRSFPTACIFRGSG